MRPDLRALAVYVIYKNPTDYPGRIVLRRQLVHAGRIDADPQPMYVGASIDEAHARLPPGLCRLAYTDPDPAICQVWI